MYECEYSTFYLYFDEYIFPVLNILEYFGTHIHKFLSRNIYLGMGLLGLGMCIYLSLPDTTKLVFKGVIPIFPRMAF